MPNVLPEILSILVNDHFLIFKLQAPDGYQYSKAIMLDRNML